MEYWVRGKYTHHPGWEGGVLTHMRVEQQGVGGTRVRSKYTHHPGQEGGVLTRMRAEQQGVGGTPGER